MGLRIVPGSFCEIEPDTHKAICTCLSKLTICFYNAPFHAPWEKESGKTRGVYRC
jgi:hypothetical protein